MVFFAGIGVAKAITYTTYTNYAAWSSAAGVTTNENLFADAPGPFTYMDFW